MGKKSKVSKDLESSGLLLFMFHRRVPLLIITLAAVVVSLVVSLLITPRYKSNVILYPGNLGSVSRSLIAPAHMRGDIMRFGQESDAERLLQVLHSNTIRTYIIDKYDLMEHYGIKESSRFPRTELNSKLDNNVRFRKTEYMAIEIEVLDEDPSVAAAMADDIAGYLDSVMNNILRDRAYSSFKIVEEEYLRLEQEIDLIRDSLRKIREIGVVDYESQAEVLNDAYAKAILNRDTSSINFFRDKLRTLSAYGGAYVSLRDKLLYQTEKLSEIKSVYNEARIDAERMIPHTFIVENATEAEKKTYPVRSLIVVVSTVSAFLLAFFTLLLADAVKRKVLVHGKALRS